MRFKQINGRKDRNMTKRKGEDGILDLIAAYFPNRHKNMPVGRGDDCALIAVPPAPGVGQSPLFAVTSDIFAENAHFRTAYFTAEDIGHKALAVNISDLASNGAVPCAFSFNLTLTERQDFAWLEACFKSMAELAGRYGMVLCGGDLTKVPLAKTRDGADNLDMLTVGGLNLGITAWGTYEHGGVPLMRHRSYAKTCQVSRTVGDTAENSAVSALPVMKAGDAVFYIGEIGLARTGLFVLESCMDREKGLREFPRAVTAHLKPEPRVREGLLLSEFAVRYPLFVMDISDGLMRDIPRLLAREGLVFDDEKAFGAELCLKQNDIHDEVVSYCGIHGLDPVHFAYKGGEDYGLVGVCGAEAYAQFETFCGENGIALHRLGTVTEQDRITLNGKNMEEAGFDHFQ